MPDKSLLDNLRVLLEQAKKDCERYAIPAHAVRNCPSDLERRDQAWRRRQDIEYQIAQLEKAVDTPKTLNK